MKSRALTYLCLCVLALSPVMCGKNKSTNPTQSQYAVYDYSDTVALRAILDANSLTAISAGNPGNPPLFWIMLDPNNNHRIQELDLGDKGISVIPAQIGALSAMTILRLDSNAISVLPAEIARCTSLVLLRLSNNQLSTLPSGISSLHNLKTLVLSHNAIVGLPQTLWTITSLTELDLDYNQLDSLSSQVSNLVNLGSILLNNNSLTTLPPSLQQIGALEYMQIDNNHICPSTLDAAFTIWLDQRAEQHWDTTQGTCP